MKTKITLTKLTRALVLALAFSGLLFATSARANLSLNLFSATHYRNYSGFSNDGNLICQFSINGNHQGDLKNSYNCSSTLTSIQYCGGDHASQGTCLVLRDNRGGCFVWNIYNWDGKEQIDCNVFLRHFHCDEIEVYGKCQPKDCNPPPCNPPPSTCVPEPTTFFAGALMLAPLGVQGVRQIRKRRLGA